MSTERDCIMDFDQENCFNVRNMNVKENRNKGIPKMRQMG